jgi:hypothetical protein
MKNKFQCITCLSFIFWMTTTHAQKVDSQKIPGISCDTLTKKEFRKLLKSSYSYIKNKMTIDEPKMINLIRVYNTLHLEANNRFDKGIGHYFLVEFRDVYIDKAMELISFKPYKDSWYSEKYDLFITSGYQMKCHNYYHIR